MIGATRVYHHMKVVGVLSKAEGCMLTLLERSWGGDQAPQEGNIACFYNVADQCCKGRARIGVLFVDEEEGKIQIRDEKSPFCFRCRNNCEGGSLEEP